MSQYKPVKLIHCHCDAVSYLWWNVAQFLWPRTSFADALLLIYCDRLCISWYITNIHRRFTDVVRIEIKSWSYHTLLITYGIPQWVGLKEIWLKEYTIAINWYKHFSLLFSKKHSIRPPPLHGIIMSTMTYQITSLTTVYSTLYSGADQRKHQSSASLAHVLGIHWWPVNSPHKWPVTRKMFPFDDVIMRDFVWTH